MSERILVTGGAGYLGSVLVPELLQAGHSVTVLDSFLFGQTSLLDCVHHEKLHVVRGDARDESRLRPLVAEADVLIPLACLTGAPLCDREPVAARGVILDALDALLNLRSRDQRLLYPTTNSGYGVGEEGIHCTEETPLRPVSLYGKLKVEAEQRILDSGNGITFRLATAFGISPRMRLDLLVNDFTYRAVTDRFIVLFESHFKRNFIHVRDVAHAFLHGLARYDTMNGRPYNVGLDDANLSKVELCEVIRKQVPDFIWVEAPVGEDPDKRNYIVSNARIAATGFEPRVSLEKGVVELVKGYQILRRNQFSNV
ncbi:MAG: NAD-dependent epimerase/dehydratase family protein [Myxococcota bacterium]